MKRVFRIIFVIFAGAFVLVAFGGCASFDRSADAPADAQPSPPAAGEESAAGGTGTASGDAAGQSGATSQPTGPEDLMRDLRPRDGKAVFLGVANRLRDRDEERDAAIRHIAEQASRYVRIRASYQYISERDGRSVGYLDNIDTAWDTAFAEQLIDSVTVLEEYQDNGGTYVLGHVDGIPAPPSIPSVTSPGEGQPAWINTPPDIPGYLSTIGIITPSRRFRDSVDRADQEALKGLLQQTGTTVRMIEDRKEQQNRTDMLVTTAQEAEATLRNFYIVARYVDPSGRYYYSLAVAREE